MEKKETLCILDGNEDWDSHCGKTVWMFLKTLKTKMELLYDPVIPLVGIYPKKTETLIQKDTCTLFYFSIISNNQDMEATQVSIHR